MDHEDTVHWSCKPVHDSPKLLDHYILVCLATVCVVIKGCNCYYKDATWYSPPIVNMCNLLSIIYIMTTIL
jgi:hypothetical protein